jgi:hypothetical protein
MGDGVNTLPECVNTLPECVNTLPESVNTLPESIHTLPDSALGESVDAPLTPRTRLPHHLL